MEAYFDKLTVWNRNVLVMTIHLRLIFLRSCLSTYGYLFPPSFMYESTDTQTYLSTIRTTENEYIFNDDNTYLIL